MPRAQCVVHRGDQVLMAKHRQDGVIWWCLPGGGVEEGETPAGAALRELQEECGVTGRLVREISMVVYSPHDKSYTYLVDIGDQEPVLGLDPGIQEQVLTDLQWLTLREIPERDRSFIISAGLLSIEEFRMEVHSWGNGISYPG